MISAINMTAPPVICASCSHEIPDLFCVRCALARLGDGDILALAKNIRRMVKRPALQTCAPADCLLCSQRIPVGTTAKLLARHSYAHEECVCRMRERLDELLPQRKLTPVDELPFGDAYLEVK